MVNHTLLLPSRLDVQPVLSLVRLFDKITCPIYPSGVKIDRFAELDTGHLSVSDSPELISRLILPGE